MQEHHLKKLFCIQQTVAGFRLASLKIILQMREEEDKGITISSLSAKTCTLQDSINIDLYHSNLKTKKVKRSGVDFSPLYFCPFFSVAVKSPAKGRAGFRGDDGRDAPAVCNGEISEWQLLFSSQQLEEGVRWGEGFITERTRQSEKKEGRKALHHTCWLYLKVWNVITQGL